MKSDGFKSLRYFVNRSQVLTQYRKFLRTTSPLSGDVKADVRRQIRSGFDAYRDVEDETLVRQLLQQSNAQLKQVSELVDSAVARQQQESNLKHGSLSWTDPMASTEPTEDGEQPDVRGRLGVGWPWKSGQPQRRLELGGIKRSTRDKEE